MVYCAGKLIVYLKLLIKAIDHTFYGFTSVITHVGCWENARKACKSRAKGLLLKNRNLCTLISSGAFWRLLILNHVLFRNGHLDYEQMSRSWSRKIIDHDWSPFSSGIVKRAKGERAWPISLRKNGDYILWKAKWCKIWSHARITITFNDHIRIQDMKINQIQQASRSYSRSYITFNMNIPDIHI